VEPGVSGDPVERVRDTEPAFPGMPHSVSSLPQPGGVVSLAAPGEVGGQGPEDDLAVVAG
jgi:hypothetical protein